MKDVIETKCGNCRHWYPWKALAVPGVISERRMAQKGKETGCDGKCTCCYAGQRPQSSDDACSARHCDFYSTGVGER